MRTETGKRTETGGGVASAAPPAPDHCRPRCPVGAASIPPAALQPGATLFPRSCPDSPCRKHPPAPALCRAQQLNDPSRGRRLTSPAAPAMPRPPPRTPYATRRLIPRLARGTPPPRTPPQSIPSRVTGGPSAASPDACNSLCWIDGYCTAPHRAPSSNVCGRRGIGPAVRHAQPAGDGCGAPGACVSRRILSSIGIGRMPAACELPHKRCRLRGARSKESTCYRTPTRNAREQLFRNRIFPNDEVASHFTASGRPTAGCARSTGLRPRALRQGARE